MSRLSIVLLACVLAGPPTAATVHAQSSPSSDQQIAAATLAAPEEMRAGARVLGYSPDGELIPLREGTNELICLADDPADSRFHVACYMESLEPFMARGRELRAQGMSGDDVNRVRGEEANAGTLEMPEGSAALYSLSGGPEGYDAETNTLGDDVRPLYVVYMPWATTESTGLSSQPKTGAPWLMNAGLPWAHVMYVPVPATPSQ